MIDPTTPNQELPGLAATKKRGRPSTGKAMTAAQRKREQRSRDLTRVYEEKNLNNVTDTGLVALLAKKTAPGWNANGGLAKDVWEELGKRRGWL